MGENKKDTALFRAFNLKTSGNKLPIKYLAGLLLLGVFFYDDRDVYAV
ncbi:MAG: hypothetical protein LRY73_01555 [Bacillus sp. (in: Bacteria)]|nr:hypothetical protein [Bacillus sp. (in: firmicutes)]